MLCFCTLLHRLHALCCSAVVVLVVVVVWHLCKIVQGMHVRPLSAHSAYHRSFSVRNVVYNELNFNRCNKLQFATLMYVCARVCVSASLIHTCIQITHECVCVCARTGNCWESNNRQNAKYGLAPDPENGPTKKRSVHNSTDNSIVRL